MTKDEWDEFVTLTWLIRNNDREGVTAFLQSHKGNRDMIRAIRVYAALNKGFWMARADVKEIIKKATENRN